MFRQSAVLLFLITPPSVAAQPPVAGGNPNPPLRFKWQVDQSVTYKVTQQTVVRETVLDEKTEKPVTTVAKTNLALVRRWTVKAVDATGVATLEMTITAMKNEFLRPDGSSVVRDSADPEHAREMAAYLNVPVVTVKVDSQGKLVEVKEAKAGSGARLQAELPFRMVLPDTGPTVGQTWVRAFQMKLDPPLGTGESHEFSQSFRATEVKTGLLVMAVETALKDPPKALAERIPLVPMLWTGEVYFSTTANRYHAARLKAKAELLNHQGQGTKFEYESVYSEDVVEK